MNLTETHMTDLIFNILKIPAECCIKLDMQTGRYENKELLVSPNTDLSQALTGDSPKIFKQHEVYVTIISDKATKVTFKGVPILLQLNCPQRGNSASMSTLWKTSQRTSS